MSANITPDLAEALTRLAQGMPLSRPTAPGSAWSQQGQEVPAEAVTSGFQQGLLRLRADGSAESYQVELTVSGGLAALAVAFEADLASDAGESAGAAPVPPAEQLARAPEPPQHVERQSRLPQGMLKLRRHVPPPERNRAERVTEQYGLHPILVTQEDLLGAAGRLSQVASGIQHYTAKEWCQAVELYLRNVIDEVLGNPGYYVGAEHALAVPFNIPATCAACDQPCRAGSRFCEAHAVLLANPEWTAQPAFEMES